ncbi:MAG TPA: DUF3267 domain-containing protein [Bacteroidales bacterium]|nr:DUF3267 domain-containing protein [Bacteroidales bacterium]
MEINSNQIEEVIEVGKANLQALLMLFPIAAMAIIPFVLVNGFEPLINGVFSLKNHQLHILLAFPLLILIHEGLHGVTWAFFAKSGFKSISFGIKWSYLTPYCHCSEPLKRNHYILGGIMPGLITGISPMVYAIATANGWLSLASIFLTVAASGDFLVLKRVLKYPLGYIFLDHPKAIGFIVIEN